MNCRPLAPQILVLAIQHHSQPFNGWHHTFGNRRNVNELSQSQILTRPHCRSVPGQHKTGQNGREMEGSGCVGLRLKPSLFRDSGCDNRVMSSIDLNDLQLRPYPETPLDYHNLAKAAESVCRSAEEWYVQTRKEIGDSRLRLEPVVLKPGLCDDCASRMESSTLLDKLFSKRPPELIPVLPLNPVPERVRLYDRANRLLDMGPHETEPSDWYGIRCSLCGQHIDNEGFISVIEESFESYFGFPDPDDDLYLPNTTKLRGKARRQKQERVVELYGTRCFECGTELTIGETLTLDHILARHHGGTWDTINLQPFCKSCQDKKANSPVQTITVALDMLLRPPPCDSFEGPVW
ncbi:MAG TPA: HNH endonuclease signature motif containing protein [Ktedonobacteraceae bacterium]